MFLSGALLWENPNEKELFVRPCHLGYGLRFIL